MYLSYIAKAILKFSYLCVCFPGPLLNEIVTHMYQKKNGTLNPDSLLLVYSAHDTTMVNLLNTMRLYEYSLVPYAAVLMIELRSDVKGNHVVTVSFAFYRFF